MPGDLFELTAIAEAKNPQTELERMRKLTRERVKKFREKQAREEQMLEPERADLIKWAKTAAIADVTRHWRHIKRAIEGKQILPPSTANSNLESAA